MLCSNSRVLETRGQKAERREIDSRPPFHLHSLPFLLRHTEVLHKLDLLSGSSNTLENILLLISFPPLPAPRRLSTTSRFTHSPVSALSAFSSLLLSPTTSTSNLASPPQPNYINHLSNHLQTPQPWSSPSSLDDPFSLLDPPPPLDSSPSPLFLPFKTTGPLERRLFRRLSVSRDLVFDFLDGRRGLDKETEVEEEMGLKGELELSLTFSLLSSQPKPSTPFPRKLQSSFRVLELP